MSLRFAGLGTIINLAGVTHAKCELNKLFQMKKRELPLWFKLVGTIASKFFQIQLEHDASLSSGFQLLTAETN